MKYDVTHRGIGMTSQRTRERLIQRLRDAGVKNSLVLEIIRNTPRHIFVDEALASRAYEDTALPIGNGQTLSQPYVVARMTEALLEHGTPERVLEIGAGSGYQTAILAQLVKHVFAVERLGALAGKARERLRDLGLYNIQLRHADGFLGWPQHAPYDAILVAAAPDEIPGALLAQLALGGRLVIPVGCGADQNLIRVTRTADGYERETLGEVNFVPLLGGRS
ncbi:MAG: protein-L-isoaspartate(D-aspartate) O-methyltransferase [Proteobacteria bacterium]|nr:MAG: protein-L-isoaspartate(D-aspartate) O-methyltransferase [Pseudomonadota bacterium]QKK12508.1 MAG: protein-L-isoaspartate(D-aspartate) O-methyltransferase [Pseudomonadota bacterium]